jgi:hypothetical protein
MKKINLLFGVGDVLDTHTNINPFATKEQLEEFGSKIIRDDIFNLDKYVDNSEANEILAYDVIDYIPLDRHEEVIENWVGKIRIGGRIVIGGTDLFEVCKSFSQYKIGSSEANELIHGSQEKPYLIKKLTHTALGMSEHLKNKFNLKIKKKRISGYKMIVEAERPL